MACPACLVALMGIEPAPEPKFFGMSKNTALVLGGLFAAVGLYAVWRTRP